MKYKSKYTEKADFSALDKETFENKEDTIISVLKSMAVDIKRLKQIGYLFGAGKLLFGGKKK
jgi:hypothetical protein